MTKGPERSKSRNKGKGGKKDKKPEPPPEEKVTVAQCLVWPKTKADIKEERRVAAMMGEPLSPEERVAKFSQKKKGEVGRAKSRGFEMPEDDLCPTVKDDGTAIEALRGWPKHGSGETGEDGEHQDGRESVDEYMLNNALSARSGCDTGRQGKSNKKMSKKEAAKAKKEEEEHDPNMHDLMSHRFMYEGEQDRLAEMRAHEESLMAEEDAKAAIMKRGVIMNRTAQLRQIHTGNQLGKDNDPKNLWKMPRFTKKARPHIESRRPKEKNSKKDGGEDEDDFKYGGYYNTMDTARTDGATTPPKCTCGPVGGGNTDRSYDFNAAPASPMVF